MMQIKCVISRLSSTAIFSFLASSLYVLSAIYDNALGIASIFCGMTLISFGVIYFKNVSSCILKRLLLAKMDVVLPCTGASGDKS